MKPTDEQKREFWELCGFKIVVHYVKHSEFWEYPDGELHPTYPPIDLNNLFQYAVPKLKEGLDYPQETIGFPTERYKCHRFLQMWVYSIAIQGKDPALALFWAIYKVLKEAKK